MKRLCCLLLALLCACSKPSVVSIFPSVIPYSQEQQAGLSEELTAHPDLKYVPLFLEGYAKTRDSLRAVSYPEIPYSSKSNKE